MLGLNQLLSDHIEPLTKNFALGLREDEMLETNL
jgi:hypothetical protein